MSGGEDLIEDNAEHEDDIDAQEPEEKFFGGGEIAAGAVVVLFGRDELVGLEGSDDGGEVFATDLGRIGFHRFSLGHVFFRPFGAGSGQLLNPRLAPWALFLRRCAAGGVGG